LLHDSCVRHAIMEIREEVKEVIAKLFFFLQCVRAKEKMKMSVKVAKEKKNGDSRRESLSRRHTRKQEKKDLMRFNRTRIYRM
jgi:tmRNA-binding protein